MEEQKTPKNPLQEALEQVAELMKKQEENTKRIESVKNGVEILVENGLTQFVDAYNKLTSENQNLSETLKSVSEQGNERIKKSFLSAIESMPEAELKLSEQDRATLENTEDQIKRFKALSYFSYGLCGLCLLIAGVAMYMASSWYKTSVVSKEEIRTGVLQEINNSGKIIVDAETYKVLENERKMIESWSKRNENEAKSFQAFREGAISAQPQLKVFNSNTGNSIHQGN